MPNVGEPGARSLSFAKRFEQDLERVEAWYLKTADQRVADEAIDAIVAQAERIARLGLQFRPGYKHTRECPLPRHPFLLIYRERLGDRPLRKLIKLSVQHDLAQSDPQSSEGLYA